ncbi:hypothetical protein GO491_01945 [Flavobacteriaceae bacterium Ap0902]|nr:hypothetical protein [Flavobacteriaceae bacterium Ap0902]
MNLRERLKLFALGSIAGIFLITLFFGRRTSCKDSIINYLPEGRVKQEILFYPIDYSSQVAEELERLNINDSLFKTYIEKADIDFGLSNQRARPCGEYVLFSEDSIQQLEIHLDKCREGVLIEKIITKPLAD